MVLEWKRWAKAMCGLLLGCLTVLVSGTGAMAEEKQLAVTLPPGFYDRNPIAPELWSPSSPVKCDVAYVPDLTRKMPHYIRGGGNPVLDEINHFFYFPVQQTVYTFIDPRHPRIYGKDVLDADYGISINFYYPGGFPTSFNGMHDVNVIHGDVTYPVPNDRWSRVVNVTWPFIKRDATVYNLENHCRLNGNCYCLKR